MTQLWRSSPAGSIGLQEAIGAAAEELGADPIGFLSTPTDHRFVRLTDRGLDAPAGVPDLASVFEARIFGVDAELRWVRSGPGGGAAVLVAEEEPGVWAGTPTPAEVMHGAYALWGRRFEPGPVKDWCRALEGRIGAVDVPYGGPPPVAGGAGWPAGYLELRYREYLVQDGYGNVRVADERLIGIGVTKPSTGGSS